MMDEKRELDESEIQSAHIKWLEEVDGWIVLRSISNTKIGYPDVTALKKRHALFIEYKRKGGKLSPAQSFRKQQLEAQGFTVLVINEVELGKYEVIQYRTKYGI
jgi:hypothetical protein